MVSKLFGLTVLAYLFAPGASETSPANITASTPSTKSINERFLELRRLKTEKDADLVIRMTSDFVKDMQHKMTVMKRIERVYERSSDFAVASVYDDIQRRFKHMCDLYKQFATVDRYILGNQLNDSGASPDVVIVYQIMLSDYNEILMIMELLKKEQVAWAAGAEDDVVRQLVLKQMEKFGNLPDDIKPPQIEVGNITTKEARRKWSLVTAPEYQRKWSGELDGVSFDNR